MLEVLHYTEHAPPSTSAQHNLEVVVLLHGLFGNGDNLSVIRRHLQNDYRVINIDLPDHGNSPWSQTFSFKTYAQQVLSTLNSLGINKANIVGHSLGGKVAMWIAYLQPASIQKLIILDIAPVAYSPRHEEVINGLRAVPLATIRSRKEAQAFMAPFISEQSTQAFLLKSLYEQNDSWYWRFNLDLLQHDYNVLIHWTLADEVVFSEPVLFIKGDESDYILPSHQNTIKKQFPKATAKVVNAGHWLHAQKTQIVNRLITKHLRGE